jgi:hypothetical protein
LYCLKKVVGNVEILGNIPIWRPTADSENRFFRDRGGSEFQLFLPDFWLFLSALDDIPTYILCILTVSAAVRRSCTSFVRYCLLAALPSFMTPMWIHLVIVSAHSMTLLWHCCRPIAVEHWPWNRHSSVEHLCVKQRVYPTMSSSFFNMDL